MSPEQLVTALAALQHEAIVRWKKGSVALTTEGFLRLVEENHAYNYQLWHEEDKARRDDKGFEFVYHAKRNIDRFNQARNNCMEKMDQWLNESLQPQDPTKTPVNSETPGMMIDRLSILALKQFHMALQTIRQDVDKTHIESCQNKLGLIVLQREQLLTCLATFLQEIAQGTRTFRLYHQLKMYNDKTLNPELY